MGDEVSSPDDIVKELEKVSDKENDLEKAARNTTPEDPKMKALKDMAKMLGVEMPDVAGNGHAKETEITVYTSSQARQERENHSIDVGHYRSKSEMLEEQGKAISHFDRGSIFADSDKEQRSREYADAKISAYVGWDDANKHLVRPSRLTPWMKGLLKVLPIIAAIGLLGAFLFDRPLIDDLQAQIGPWFNNTWNEAWLLALAVALLLIVVFLIRRRQI